MNILLISLLGCLVVALPSARAQKVKWCVKAQKELDKCERLAIKSADSIVCLHKPSISECIKSIREGEADAVTVDGEQVYLAGLKPHELRPIIAEKSKKEPCYAVAVVKRGTDFSIKDLKGKTSCHCCYQSPGSWNLPIGSLVKAGIIDWAGSDDMPLEKAVSQFFSRSCVPGISKADHPNLCSTCQGDCSCSQSAGQKAFECLKKGDADVAFICQDRIPVSERQDYQLLCMDGTRKDVEQYKDCHFGKEPPRAVIAHKDADRQHIYKVLTQVSGSFLFTSDSFGVKDLIFSDSATGLEELPKITDSFLYLGHDYYETMRFLKATTLPPPASESRIRWCTISHAEKDKCDKLDIMECRSATSVDECIQKVMRREADAFAADGGQVYIAGKCGLVPAMVEQYDEHGCPNSGEPSSYHVVAVVRKGSGVTWSNLKGRKSCHTGLNRNAGWKVPDSVICGKTPNCLYTFFSEGCAPGADAQSSMCKLCIGSQSPVGGDISKCKASSAERYYGYDGAFRCLAEKAGDVAFIKHSIVGDYTDGKGPEWAKKLMSEGFELICPDSPDRTFKYSEFAECKLATVPAHAVITREDVRKDVVTVLAAQSPGSLFKSEGERNLLFSDSTKCLQEYTKSVEEFLTEPYIKMIEKTYETGQGVPDLVKACTLDSILSS
ncbi:transferrin-a [Pimephales promelas]|uniref:transferrin-a n=1 Tax=Pimephales promelas TaxID=90988 RepID=UPI001955DE45|nr:transferrin-a [Pimephales promelas]KAG1969302.1 melanotransferrin [Pimephales promelas]